MEGIGLRSLVMKVAIASTLGNPPQKSAWSLGVAACHGSERDEIIGGGIILSHPKHAFLLAGLNSRAERLDPL
jgi:hypothetical protein